MYNSQPVPGERWVSDSEPELGLGVIVSVGSGRVEILFPTAGERRQYALSGAPLRRVVFAPGDRVRLGDGTEGVVEGVERRDGLLVYRVAGEEVPESGLSDMIGFTGPETRLMSGRTDDLETFDLRVEALRFRSLIHKSPVRGYIGGRIELIPHQLSIAGEVSSRLLPRVLLADEVGLGKTIEAGLILHRLHLTGRADRVLILVPEPLVHQWFVELLRRFNLPFSIFDEERCRSIERQGPGANPFLEGQLILCSIGLLAGKRRRADQAREAGWDLLVVDEAHHLEWSPKRSSDGYRVVESLATTIPGVLLLTATPQQLGPEGHFARLRLLDPDRYADIQEFLKEAGYYESVARAVERIIEGGALTTEDQALFAGGSERVRRYSEELAAGVPGAANRLIGSLLDSFGTGRVMFRNTRAALSGFPRRVALLAPLGRERGDLDPVTVKVQWLAGLLKELGDEKVLLICGSRELAEEIHSRLAYEINVNASLFHEGLSLVRRDRNAAYFADRDGARILICSEIGSEGRNFQFAHHMVLFDLPPDPELLEQRIGRLDRIGQKGSVNIHVPYLPGTESEVLARWYHAGLNAFEESPHGASEVLHAVEGELQALRREYDDVGLRELIERSRQERQNVASKLEHGYDRLLQLNSNRPEQSRELIRQIEAADNDRSFEEFVLRLFEHYGVHIEKLAPRTYSFRPDYLTTDAFPALPEGGLAATFDRTRALSREDLAFMTWDHPMVRSVIELMVDGEEGSATFAIWKSSSEQSLLLEVHAVVECVAPAAFHADRFLPPTPVRVVVDHDLRDRTDDLPPGGRQLIGGDISPILEKEEVRSMLLPEMLESAVELATKAMRAMVSEALKMVARQIGEEIERLEDLHQINSNVSLEEIEGVRGQQAALVAAIGSARLRVGALRLIVGRG